MIREIYWNWPSVGPNTKTSGCLAELCDKCCKKGFPHSFEITQGEDLDLISFCWTEDEFENGLTWYEEKSINMKAKQCMFMPIGIDDDWYPGFVFGDIVVCTCCGQAYARKDVRFLYLYDEWKNLSYDVMKERDLPTGLVLDKEGYIDFTE